MKKVLIFFLLLPAFTFSQKIDGIGFLKINKTTVHVIDSLTGAGYKLATKEIETYTEEEKNNEILELKINTKNPEESLLDAPKSKKHRVFDISNIDLSFLTIKKLQLHFLNDTLYQITIDGPQKELDEALTTKYGTPKMESKTKIVECTYKYTGAKTKNEELRFHQYYRKDNIEAYKFSSKTFDSKCQPFYFSVFLLYDQQKNKRVNLLERLAQAELEKSIELSKKKALQPKLKDF